MVRFVKITSNDFGLGYLGFKTMIWLWKEKYRRTHNDLCLLKVNGKKACKVRCSKTERA